jgi:hypothetical protein
MQPAGKIDVDRWAYLRVRQDGIGDNLLEADLRHRYRAAYVPKPERSIIGIVGFGIGERAGDPES